MELILLELIWIAVLCTVPVWVLVVGLLYILWPWRQLPAILAAMAMPPHEPPELPEDTPTDMPEQARWYQEPDPPSDPTKKNVFWPSEPGE